MTKEDASSELERLGQRVEVLEAVVAQLSWHSGEDPYSEWGSRIIDALGPPGAVKALVKEATRQMDAESEEPAFEWWCFTGSQDAPSVVTWDEILEVPIVKTWVNATGFRRLVLLERRRDTQRHMTLFALVRHEQELGQAVKVQERPVPLGTLTVPLDVEPPCEEVTSL